MRPERNRTRIIRLYKIEEALLSQHGLTVIQLCSYFRVNRRTIYRDLSLMQELEIPIHKEGSRFKILGTYKIPSYRPQIAASA